MATARALQLKEDGNKCFQSGDYVGAEALYSKAIMIDTTNPLLYTNRAMARLKLSLFESVIPDCDSSLSLLAANMKAYYYKAQAELELGRKQPALQDAETAYELCSGIQVGSRKGLPSRQGYDKAWEKSLGAVSALVLRCKKEVWEAKERSRLRAKSSLLTEMLELLETECTREITSLKDEELDKVEKQDRTDEIKVTSARKAGNLKNIWEQATGEKRREVPDWAIDDITFSIMHDPVVTKTGHSYERASIIEHLRHSATDPLTREPLSIAKLRPNLGLKAACDEFLTENGWAVDW